MKGGVDSGWAVGGQWVGVWRVAVGEEIAIRTSRTAAFSLANSNHSKADSTNESREEGEGDEGAVQHRICSVRVCLPIIGSYTEP